MLTVDCRLLQVHIEVSAPRRTCTANGSDLLVDFIDPFSPTPLRFNFAWTRRNAALMLVIILFVYDVSRCSLQQVHYFMLVQVNFMLQYSNKFLFQATCGLCMCIKYLYALVASVSISAMSSVKYCFKRFQPIYVYMHVPVRTTC